MTKTRPGMEVRLVTKTRPGIKVCWVTKMEDGGGGDVLLNVLRCQLTY